MNQKNLFTRSALAVAVSLVASNAFAAGFQLNEYSTSALGRAFSGEGAVADDASVGSRNPAAMTLFDRPAFSAGAIYINPGVILRVNPLSQATVRMPVISHLVPWCRICILLCRLMINGLSGHRLHQTLASPLSLTITIRRVPSAVKRT
ncbi:outer membrane protein transport protein [Morganella psychrotolerans]|uniref:outer membrane protein transport protein n=1 Tax=Morganella psychrotolerans TaxID=368603 RepID=UPI000A89D9EC